MDDFAFFDGQAAAHQALGDAMLSAVACSAPVVADAPRPRARAAMPRRAPVRQVLVQLLRWFAPLTTAPPAWA